MTRDVFTSLDGSVVFGSARHPLMPRTPPCGVVLVIRDYVLCLLNFYLSVAAVNVLDMRGLGMNTPCLYRLDANFNFIITKAPFVEKRG